MHGRSPEDIAARVALAVKNGWGVRVDTADEAAAVQAEAMARHGTMLRITIVETRLQRDAREYAEYFASRRGKRGNENG